MTLTEAKITAFLAKHFGTLDNEKFEKAQEDLAYLLQEVVADVRAPLLLKIQSQEATIKRMKEIMEDNDIHCTDCDGELSGSELEEGLCISCARLLS